MLADSGVSSQFSEWREIYSRFHLANKRILSPIIWAGYTHQRFLTILKGDATTANCTRPCVDARCICPSSFAVVTGSFAFATEDVLSRFGLPTLYQALIRLSSTFFCGLQVVHGRDFKEWLPCLTLDLPRSYQTFE